MKVEKPSWNKEVYFFVFDQIFMKLILPFFFFFFCPFWRNSSQPPKPTFQVHTYETVDVDEDKPREDKPKEDKPRTDKSKEDKLEIHEKKAKEEKPKIENPNEDISKIDKPKENKSNRDKPKDDKPKVKPATRGVCRTVDALGGPPDSVLPRGNMFAQPKSSEKHSLPPVGVVSHKPARYVY